jgi:hypothetical protein
MVIMVVVLMLSITGATLSLNRLELKKTSNHKLGTQALGVADAGLQHAFAAMPAGINFPYNTETQLSHQLLFPPYPASPIRLRP